MNLLTSAPTASKSASASEPKIMTDLALMGGAGVWPSGDGYINVALGSVPGTFVVPADQTGLSLLEKATLMPLVNICVEHNKYRLLHDKYLTKNYNLVIRSSRGWIAKGKDNIKFVPVPGGVVSVVETAPKGDDIEAAIAALKAAGLTLVEVTKWLADNGAPEGSDEVAAKVFA